MILLDFQFRHMWIITSPLLIRLLLPKGTGGLALFPFIFIAQDEIREDPVFIHHEMIHIRQQAEMLLIIFLLWYYLEFLIRLIQYRDWKLAYRNISFEREAYARENELSYLKTRRFWAFLKYVQIPA